MERPLLGARSVPADVSEFFRAELAAFVALQKRQRPLSWARVERLQQVCRGEAPATTTAAAGLHGSKRALGGASAA